MKRFKYFFVVLGVLALLLPFSAVDVKAQMSNPCLSADDFSDCVTCCNEVCMDARDSCIEGCDFFDPPFKGDCIAHCSMDSKDCFGACQSGCIDTFIFPD